jgi:hypothetical protein
MTKLIATLPNWLVFILIIASMVAGSFMYEFGILSIVFLFIWLYSLGYECNKLLPNETHLPINRLIIALSYAGIYCILLFYVFNIRSYVIPFHLLAMFCIFYSLYFVAKSIRSVELGRTAKFEEYAAVFFGLWFSPIGVWFIQNKMRRIVQTDGNNH